MAQKTLLEIYQKLEYDVEQALIQAVNNSSYVSKHNGFKAIKVNVFDYTELTLIDTRLNFLDRNGHQYGLYTDCTIEDLIDILKP